MEHPVDERYYNRNYPETKISVKAFKGPPKTPCWAISDLKGSKTHKSPNKSPGRGNEIPSFKLNLPPGSKTTSHTPFCGF